MNPTVCRLILPLMMLASRWLRLSALALLFTSGTVLDQVTPVDAATFVVTTTTDVVDAGDGLISLREAIESARTSVGPDTITLAAATYELSLGCGADENFNAGGDLDIIEIEALSIAGPSNASRATITLATACTGERLIDHRNPTLLAITNVNLVGGDAPDAAAVDTDGASGGAIRSEANSTIALENVDLTGNRAGDAGRSVASNPVGGSGGAIATQGSLSLTNVAATGNSAGAGYTAGSNTFETWGGSGGAIHQFNALGTLTILDSTFTGNTAGNGGANTGAWGGAGGEGGAVYTTVLAATITGSTFTGNIAGNGGTAGTSPGRDGGRGGALLVGAQAATITGSTFSANTSGRGSDAQTNAGSGGYGGAVYLMPTGSTITATIDQSTFTGNIAGNGGAALAASGSALAGRGGAGGAVAIAGAGNSVTIMSSTFTSNQGGNGGNAQLTSGSGTGGMGGGGGAVWVWGASAAVSGSTFELNASGDGGNSTGAVGSNPGNGGGIGADTLGLNSPFLEVSSSSFVSNSTGTASYLTGTYSGSGGGISFFGNGTTMDVSSSSFVTNHADGGTNDIGDGGAIQIGGPVTATLANSTLHGNSADGAGGGLWVGFAAEAAVTASTITDNSAAAGASAAIHRAGSSTVTISGSVLAEVDAATTVTCAETLTSLGYNAELGTANCSSLSATGDATGVARTALGALGTNGGLGATRLPVAGGALVDAIPSADAACIGIDQRTAPRPLNFACDKGATELVTSVTAVDDSANVTTGVDTTIDVVTNDSGATLDAGFAAAGATVTSVTTASSGTASVVSGAVHYTAAAAGTHTFTYTTCNAVETTVCDTATVTITAADPVPMLNPVTPTRLFDTRPEKGNGAIVVPKAKIGGATELRIDVNGIAGIPASGVAAVSLNVTATQPTAAGFIIVYPCGTRPTTSNVNYSTNQTVPNAVIAPVSADGEICFYSTANTHVIADVAAWFSTAAPT